LRGLRVPLFLSDQNHRGRNCAVYLSCEAWICRRGLLVIPNPSWPLSFSLAVCCATSFRAFHQRNRLLLLRDVNGFRKKQSQLRPRPHPWPSKAPRGAGTGRQNNSALQIFQPVLPPHVLLQELRRCDSRGVMLPPLVRGKMERTGSRRSPVGPIIPPRSTKDLELCSLKRFSPNREERLLPPAKGQNSDAVDSSINSDVKRSTSAELRAKQSRTAACHSATALPCLSSSSFAREIASALAAWQEVIAPKFQSHRAA
jgi:hypothetical protein